MFENFFTKPKTKSFDWKTIEAIDDVKKQIKNSSERPKLIFKHSTRCSISSMAKQRLESSFEALNRKNDLYYLDLISYRDTSNWIAQNLNVVHQSPQVILLFRGEVIYTASHGEISAENILLAL